MTDASQQTNHSGWRLVIRDGSGATEFASITGDPLNIGRELDNDVSLDDLEVSRYHARLTVQKNQLVIEDLNSANGTLVNNTPITQPHTLHHNDVISLGSFVIRIEEIVPQAQAASSAHPAPAAKTRWWWPWLIAGGVTGLLAVVLLALFLGGWFITSSRQPVAGTPTETPIPQDVPEIVLNQAPASDSQVRVNQSITIQAIASDPSGVKRMELWVNNRQVDQISSSLAQDAPSLAAAFQWTPDTPGTYNLEIRAYNRPGRVSRATVSNLTVIGQTPTPTLNPTETPTPTATPPPPTGTPTPTPTPLPPTPTPGSASLMVSVPALNVRAGPGTQYQILGQLLQNETVEIVGQANSGQGQWWQIEFPSAPDGRGWVSADPDFVTILNTGVVPVVPTPPLPTATPTVPATPTPLPPTLTPTPAATVISAPPGKTLLIISNRSTLNRPARLTLSGGKSVGGGEEFDPPPNGEIQVVLEPDFYRALWSSPARGGFARGADFTAVAGKVMVMWIVPEEGRTDTEVYNELVVGGLPTPTPLPTPAPAIGGYSAPPGKALLVAANKSTENIYAVMTISGGSFGGGQQITLDANTETPLEMLPGSYRAVWNSPVRGGFNAGHEFSVSAGAVVLSWIIPENGQVFMQFPGQPPVQINN